MSVFPGNVEMEKLYLMNTRGFFISFIDEIEISITKINISKL